MAMTTLERYIGTIRFEPVDRVPYHCDIAWASAVRRWIKEGLPEDAVPKKDGEIPGIVALGDYFGCDKSEGPGLNVNLGILPPFEHEIIAEDELTRTERHGLGITQRTFKNNPETSMPEFIDHPVKTRKEWQEMKKRYDPSTPGRLPENWGDQLIEELKNATHPIGVGTSGLYWTLRDWLGAERLLLTFYDDPWMIHDMMETLTNLWIETLKPVVEKVQMHSFGLSEDMAYRNASLISPAMFREFMAPRYRRLTSFLKDHGVEHICIDCDGLLDELLPLFMECGVTAITPVEIQCGNDPVAMRKKFGKNLVIHGGIDKRALAGGEDAIRKEMESKVPWLLEQGGYFPSIDHAVPYDVSFKDFCYYMELKKKMIGA